MIELTINSEKRGQFGEPLTVQGLLEQLKMNSPAIAVEVNQTLVPKSQFASTPLHDGDVLEIVTLVGGG